MKEFETCPYAEDFGFGCPYKDDNDMCDDVEINSRNGDAWCFKEED